MPAQGIFTSADGFTCIARRKDLVVEVGHLFHPEYDTWPWLRMGPAGSAGGAAGPTNQLSSGKQILLGDLLQQISVHLNPPDIARLCMASRAISKQSDMLFKRICDHLGFKQTGSRFRPLPYSLIFRQHLCTECCRPAVSSGSIHVNLNGGGGAKALWRANFAVKWLCGDCRRSCSRAETSGKGTKRLPRTAERFGEVVRRSMLAKVSLAKVSGSL